MPTFHIYVTQKTQEFVQQQVKSGRYSSESEVVREALRLMFRREEQKEVEEE